MSKLPVSGSESTFTTHIYGSPRGKNNNNCYAWALDAYRDDGGVKLQPGNMSGLSTDLNASSCKFIGNRTMADSKKRGIYRTQGSSKCRRGFYKIMAFIDKGNDYHWYRQHDHVLYRVSQGETRASIATEFRVPLKNVVATTGDILAGELVFVRNANVFSHKQGFATEPLLRDASGKLIFDPRKANRNYGAYNYRTFCGAFCVRNRKPTSDIEEPEARKLLALLHKRIRLLDAGDKHASKLVPGSPKVKRGKL